MSLHFCTQIKKMCEASDQDIRVQSINFIATMAEHVSREEREKIEIRKKEYDRKPENENEKKPTLSQPALSSKYIAVVPQLALEAFLPAIISKDEKVKTTALNGIFLVIEIKINIWNLQTLKMLPRCHQGGQLQGCCCCLYQHPWI